MGQGEDFKPYRLPTNAFLYTKSMKALYKNSLKSKYLENRNFSVANMLVHTLFFFFSVKIEF